MRSLTATLTILACLMLGAAPASAQSADITFYYPVAVGGPVTRIVDGLAADFMKENPGIKVKPIYAGTYQETIGKVLTAVKSGEAPQTAILLSTDMFTLIERGLGDSLRRRDQDRRGQGVAGELLSRLHAQQP